MKIQHLKIFLGRVKHYYYDTRPETLGYCGKNVYIGYPISVHNPQNVFMHDDTSIKEGCKIINTTGKFIMKKKAGAAQGLTVITGNHHPIKGKWFYDSVRYGLADIEKDIIVEEDVRIGANVTLLCGVTVGRGCIIGANSVVRKSTPPYSIVMGNPAQVVKFIFTQDEIIEHEKALYSPEERIPLEKIKKYFEQFEQNK